MGQEYPSAVRWLIALGSIMLFIWCDAIAYQWAKIGGWLRLAAVMIVGSSGYLVFAHLCTKMPLAAAGPLVSVGVILGTVTVGTVLFDDTLNWQQKIGVVTAIISVFLLRPK